MKTNLTVVFAGMAVILAPSLGRASTIAQETFEGYATGSLLGLDGGSGWSGGWTVPGGSANVIDTTANPLTYSMLNGGTRAAQSVTTAVGSGQITESRALASPLSGSDVFVSFLLQYSGTSIFDGNDTFSFHLSSSATSTSGLNFGPRSVNGSPTFMVRLGTGGPVTGGSVSLSSPAFPAGQTFLAVAQLEWDGVGSAYNTINAWLDPAFGDSGTPLVTQTVFPGGGVASISHAFFRNFDHNGDGTSPNDFWTVDNLVIGTTWADVVPVPEPTSMALLGLGAFALVASRRRKG